MEYSQGIVKRRRIIPASSSYFAAPAGATSFSAKAVTFDGATSYAFHSGARPSGPISGVGLISFWLKMNGGNTTFQTITDDNSNAVQILRFNDNTIRFICVTSSLYTLFTTSTFVSGAGWRHVMAAWDVTIPRRQVFVDGVSDINAGASSSTNTTANYSTTSNWTVGTDTARTSNFLNADLSELYINLAETLDLSNPANVLKFRTAGGKPVDLGTDGSTPTSTAPFIYQKNPFNTYGTNSGTGGDYETTVALAAALTSPSD